MWKHHVVYESRPHSVIVTLGGHLYMIPEVVLTTTISLILEKQCHKVISQTTKFSLFMIWSEGEQKVTVTTKTLAQDLSIQHKQVNNIVEEHKDIFSSPMRVPCTSKSSIPLTWCLVLPYPMVQSTGTPFWRMRK
jgi:hypothetical protein